MVDIIGILSYTYHLGRQVMNEIQRIVCFIYPIRLA